MYAEMDEMMRELE
jgi:hypothetical protein